MASATPCQVEELERKLVAVQQGRWRQDLGLPPAATAAVGAAAAMPTAGAPGGPHAASAASGSHGGALLQPLVPLSAAATAQQAVPLPGWLEGAGQQVRPAAVAALRGQAAAAPPAVLPTSAAPPQTYSAAADTSGAQHPSQASDDGEHHHEVVDLSPATGLPRSSTSIQTGAEGDGSDDDGAPAASTEPAGGAGLGGQQPDFSVGHLPGTVVEPDLTVLPEVARLLSLHRELLGHGA
jgi:hypothetical protein